MDHPVHVEFNVIFHSYESGERKMLFSVCRQMRTIYRIPRVIRLRRFHKNCTVNKVANCIKTRFRCTRVCETYLFFIKYSLFYKFILQGYLFPKDKNSFCHNFVCNDLFRIYIYLFYYVYLINNVNNWLIYTINYSFHYWLKLISFETSIPRDEFQLLTIPKRNLLLNVCEW